MPKSQATRRVAALFSAVLAPAVLLAAEPERGSLRSARVPPAIQRALQFLAATQNADGSWSSGTHQKHAAITGLAGMAFLSAGSTPLEGPYAPRLRRAVDFLLSIAAPQTGLIGGAGEQEPVMYGHGFATLFLAEVCGMTENAALRLALRRAVTLIVECQHLDGGWRYEPLPGGESDLSVTVCELMALRAARNAGLYVPKSTIDAAIQYVKKSANPNGAFRYMLDLPEQTSFALTAAGLTALYSAGVYDSPELERGVHYLHEYLRRTDYKPAEHFFYGHYYAAQAMFQAGRFYWSSYYRGIGDELLRQQRSDGAWDSQEGDVFATAIAAIVLQMPNQYLPIFER